MVGDEDEETLVEGKRQRCLPLHVRHAFQELNEDGAAFTGLVRFVSGVTRALLLLFGVFELGLVWLGWLLGWVSCRWSIARTTTKWWHI